jgi:hypothetical protein
MPVLKIRNKAFAQLHGSVPLSRSAQVQRSAERVDATDAKARLLVLPTKVDVARTMEEFFAGNFIAWHTKSESPFFDGSDEASFLPR